MKDDMSAKFGLVRQAEPDFGALVISLDFELHWGVRDYASPTGPYRANLDGAREAIPAILRLFEEHNIRATWATVGFLFAEGANDILRFAPLRRPVYESPKLSPYAEPVGPNEGSDPIHFAPTLINRIKQSIGQEVGTHTFSHFYCLEPGQDGESFRADLQSAIDIAERSGIHLKSIVFPRNQYNPAYQYVLQELGFTCYRGNQSGTMYQHRGPKGSELWRALRLIDAYVGTRGAGTIAWRDIEDGEGLFNVAASRFLRPYAPRRALIEPLRLRRIVSGIEEAAHRHRLFHLWWHPHNFGTNLDENMVFLRRIIERFCELQESHGMRSLNMGDVPHVLSGRT